MTDTNQEWPGEWPLRVYILHPNIKTYGEFVTFPERREYIDGAKVAAMAALLDEARAVLRAYIESAYPSDFREKYASMQRQYDRDMDLCRRIDAAIATPDDLDLAQGG